MDGQAQLIREKLCIKKIYWYANQINYKVENYLIFSITILSQREITFNKGSILF